MAADEHACCRTAVLSLWAVFPTVDFSLFWFVHVSYLFQWLPIIGIGDIGLRFAVRASDRDLESEPSSFSR